VRDTSVWQLAFSPGTVAYCGATPTEWRPFLGSAFAFRLTFDGQECILAANPPVSLGKPRRLHWLGIPHAGRHDVAQPVVAHLARTRGHGLHALAITRADQPGDIDRAHPSARRMTQGDQKRPQPTLETCPPNLVQCHRRQPRQPTSAAEAMAASDATVKPPNGCLGSGAIALGPAGARSG
jgi:hypothetical protein